MKLTIQQPLTALMFVLLSITANSQDFNLGRTISFVEAELRGKEGANVVKGINKDGFVYLMDEDWDGMTVWFFDDDLICVSFYALLKSKKGQEGLTELRILVGQRGKKLDVNTYSWDGLIYKFTNPNPGQTDILVYTDPDKT